MTSLIAIDTAPAFAPREDAAPPERLIEGNPAFKTWDLDTALAGAAAWGKARTGIWEATPGTTRSIKGGTLEFCHILSGVIETSEDGGATRRFGPGDSFVMKPGFTGQWKTQETARKIFVIVS